MTMVPQRLALDFVAPPPARRVAVWLLAAGALAAAAGAAQFTLAWNDWRAQSDALARLPAADPAPAASPSRADAAGLRAAQGVARDLTAPWAELLRALEGAGTRDVALVAVEPAVARQTVRITADARHADAMLDLVAQLKRRSLTDVVLVSHQLQAQQPGTPIRFQVQARWTAAARGADR
jgi:hypothetical protein